MVVSNRTETAVRCLRKRSRQIQTRTGAGITDGILHANMEEKRRDETKMDKMTYGTIEGVNKPVSRIFFGTAGTPFKNGGDASELLDGILTLGINAIDTARVYGQSEKSIGDWIEKRGNRDQLVLLTKCCHPTPRWEKRVSEKEMRKDFARSSELLHTGYFDIYLLHRDDPEVPVGELVEAFNALHAEGKIGAFGGSNWTHERIDAANEYAYRRGLIPFTVSSPNYGLAEVRGDIWGGGSVSLSGPAEAEARAWYAETGMPVVAWSSLAAGFFSGRMKSTDAGRVGEFLDPYAQKGFAAADNFERLRRCEILAEKKGVQVPQVALSWLFHQKLNTYAVISTHSPARMEGNIAALHLPLTEEECAWLNLM